MSDNLRSNFDILYEKAAKRPVFDLLRDKKIEGYLLNCKLIKKCLYGLYLNLTITCKKDAGSIPVSLINWSISNIYINNHLE